LILSTREVLRTEGRRVLLLTDRQLFIAISCSRMQIWWVLKKLTMASLVGYVFTTDLFQILLTKLTATGYSERTICQRSWRSAN